MLERTGKGTCGRCGRQVGRLHPIPPEIVTQEFVEEMGSPVSLTNLEACEECIEELTVEE